MTNIDAISRDVFQSQVHGVANEMSVALRRASFSSIIWDMYDFSCGLFTPDGDMIAQGDTIPAQLGIMPTAIRHMFLDYPLDVWRPGDVYACNDPYRGCTHTMDICLFSPVFHDDEVVAITSTIAHHMDIGGRSAGSGGPDNEEVFAEGIILPPLELYREGVANETAFKMIDANVRMPHATIGDLRAQVAGCRTGERCLQTLAQRYGNQRLLALSHASLDYAETYTRRAITAIPDGVSEASILVEDDISSEEPFRLHAKITVSRDEIEVDVSGSDDQRPFAFNNPESATISMTHYAVKCVTTPELPQNEGCVRPITVKMRKGSILDPHRPAAVGERHHTQQALADVVLKALAPMRSEASAAGCQVSFSSILVGGVDDRSEAADDEGAPYYIVSDIVGGGMGGGPFEDGLSAVDTHGGNCAIISAEVLETIGPLRVLKSELVPDSGGRGRRRGGLGIVRDFEMLAERGIIWGASQQSREETAAWGFEGGASGGHAGFIFNPDSEDRRPKLARLPAQPIRRGDVLRVIGGGGGGWGPPSDRDPTAIDHDLHEGYTTPITSP